MRQSSIPIIQRGDALTELKKRPDGSVQCCITSPPYYGLRDYAVTGQIGAEANVAAYVNAVVAVFREVRRVLRHDGTLWMNLGDSYVHAKNLLGVPWRVALALQEDGWILRQDIIWHKPNPMPESVQDRCTRAHEYLFLLAKSQHYYFDHTAMLEPASKGLAGSSFVTGKTAQHQPGASPKPRRDAPERNRRSVWSVATTPFSGAHFATFPPSLIEPCLLAGTQPGDTVLDPFGGAGTTALVALRYGRHPILIELNPDYCRMAEQRLRDDAPLFFRNHAQTETERASA